MSDIISIHRELVRLSKSLAEAVTEFKIASIDAAERRTTYDTEWAKAMLAAPDDVTQKIKEALATKQCAEHMLGARVAEATRDALKERIRALETVLSVQQSRLRYLETTEKDFN